MKKASTYLSLAVSIVLVLAFSLSGILALTTTEVAEAAAKTTYTRQGDTVWFGVYPQTKATDEEVAGMSATADADGYYTSGKDKFVKVTSADPKEHSETADTKYIPFDDETQPVAGATYYFKMEPIEWKVMVDDADSNAVKLVSKKYLDTHCWLSQFVNGGYWATYYNTLDGVPENTPANGWRYSEMRAWLNDGFLDTAFTEEERASIFVFANTHTVEYREDDPTTIVNDYVAVGDRADYDAAGDDGRPTDYAIVKGATWCYNKDHIYYWVNDDYPMFPSNTLRLYRHDEHDKCTYADSVEAVRPIMYVKRSDAKILATESQKEEKKSNLLLIFGIVAAIVGAGMAIPFMAITSKRYKSLPKEEQKGKFPYKKHEVPLISVGLVLLIGGLLMIFLPIAINGGFGAKLSPGVYVQDFDNPSTQGNIAYIGKAAYRLNGDGTYNYAAVYEGAGSVWDVGGTWSQSGSTLTLRGKPNPMYPNGYTISMQVFSSSSFGQGSYQYKLIEG